MVSAHDLPMPPPLPSPPNEKNGRGKEMRDRTAHFAIARNDHGSDKDEESPVPTARVLIYPRTHDESTTSSLTTGTPSVDKEDGQNTSNRKCPAKSQPDQSPSPAKNPLPNFDMRPSDDDSVLSGDDSDGWEVEEDKVVSLFAEQTRKEDALDMRHW